MKKKKKIRVKGEYRSQKRGVEISIPNGLYNNNNNTTMNT